MATLTIKNLPDALYEKLKERAAGNRRSINSEAILAVERAVTDHGVTDPREMLADLRRARIRLNRVFVKDAALFSARSDRRE